MTEEQVAWMTKGVSTAIVQRLVYGLWNRARPRIHIPVMVTCFVVDVLNVLVIELSRGAVEKSIDEFSRGGVSLLGFHIFVSVVALLAYGVAVVTGTRLYRKGVGRGFHRLNAAVFLVARLANYVTSFMV